MATYKNRVEWRGDHLGYTWCQNGLEKEFSGQVDRKGPANFLTPEDAFVAAANTSYFLTVIGAAERLKMELVSLEINAVGELEECPDQTSWFKSITLYPRIVVRGQPEDQIKEALDLARKSSPICCSFKSEIIVEPTIIAV